MADLSDRARAALEVQLQDGRDLKNLVKRMERRAAALTHKPDLREISVRIRGTGPLVVHRYRRRICGCVR